MSETLEQLIVLRDKLLTTISNLELGLVAEKRKHDEFEFFRNDKNFDQEAMDEQIIRSKNNIISIEKVLTEENNKLLNISNEIDASNKIILSHGVFPCLLGTIKHTWQVLARHPSGDFQHRKCQVCGTDEKVGYL